MKSKLSLNGEWTLREDGCDETIPATVPGCVHTDLMSAGHIEDPFFGDNEEHLAWIYKTKWIYQRDFTLAKDHLECDCLILNCEGLDTVADIQINGAHLASTDNMYRNWSFDIKGMVALGRNTIAITFGSPTEYIEKRQKIYEVEYPIAPDQLPFFSQIRKEACSFGWDWGPTIASCGIWRSIHIECVNAPRFSDIMISQDHSNPKKIKLNADFSLDAAPTSEISARVSLSFDEEEILRKELRTIDSQAAFELNVEAPKLWWPNNMGDQNLYELKLELFNGNGELIDSQTRRIGFRTIELVCEKDEFGESFHFKVNGVAFFAKGANWIPADALITRLTPEKYRNLLSSAANANMNMLRVWGGGIYESDIFYDICDELGLCVWQDFMFACAPYPLSDKTFVDNVIAEMEQNVSRIRHHASLALWCGNNEVELCGFVAEKGDPRHMTLEQYKGFFEGTIPDILAKVDPEHSYWPGSPYKVRGEKYNPDYWIDSPDKGDAHFWSVWHGGEPFEFYRTSRHRFISEFGFQSFPDPASVATFTEPKDRNITTYVMERHQRNGSGNAKIMQYMLDWFRMPKDFDSTLWCSQLLQALAMKYACEHWRRSAPRTMGALIWQLNDTWPVASWATLDYFGQWKAAHFFAKRFFAPLLLSAEEDSEEGTVRIYATNDQPDDVDAVFIWKLTNLDGRMLRGETRETAIKGGANTRVADLDFKNEIQEFGKRDVLLWIELAAENHPVSRDLVLFAKPKHLELPDPRITCDVKESGNAAFTVEIEAGGLSLWTWLEMPGVHLSCSDNFINLEPGGSAKIAVTPSVPMTTMQFKNNLKARSLFDTY